MGVQGLDEGLCWVVQLLLNATKIKVVVLDFRRAPSILGGGGWGPGSDL